jgi:hypothetical protein
MNVVSPHTLPDHLDILVMQPDEEYGVVRDLTFAVFAFNAHRPDAPLQMSFPLYTDAKVSARGVLGPCVRITGPAEKLYTLTLRHEVAAHLRSGRAMTLVRDRVVIEAGRNECFSLVASTRLGATNVTSIARAEVRPLVLSGQSRLLEHAGRLGVKISNEAAFVARAESTQASDGRIDLLGFSDRKTVPVLR